MMNVKPVYFKVSVRLLKGLSKIYNCVVRSYDNSKQTLTFERSKYVLRTVLFGSCQDFSYSIYGGEGKALWNLTSYAD